MYGGGRYDTVCCQHRAYKRYNRSVYTETQRSGRCDDEDGCTDRHLNNFGFIYAPRQHRLSGMAPLFDTGNSLFYDYDVIPHGGNLLDIPVNSFSKREADQLHYVKSDAGVKLERLVHFPEEAEALLREYTDMTDERAAETARTIEEKIEYLNLFFQGKKIWKKERYW